MPWRDYYRLLVNYDGDLSKATEAELAAAAVSLSEMVGGRQVDPVMAERIARAEYKRTKHKVEKNLF